MAKNTIDKAIELSFYKQANGVQFNIMDLVKLHNDARAAMLLGTAVDEAVKAAIDKYRIK